MDDLISWWNIRQACFGRDYLIGDGFDSKNDNDKVIAILGYLSIYEKLPYVHRGFKSAETASKFIVEANRNSQSPSWQSLVEMNTQGAIHAPLDSHELIRAYTNRAVALCNGELYDDCWMDLHRLLKILYDDGMKTDSSVQTEYSTPKKDNIFDLESMGLTGVNATHTTSLLMDLLSFTSTKLDKKVNTQMFLPKTPDDNPKVMQTSAAIGLQYSEKYGRLVTATRNIKAGEVLLVHKSYASIVDIHLMHKYCWQCSKRARSGVPCYYCTSVIFCDETCREHAWQQHHEIECPVIVAMLNAKMVETDFMALRLTVRAYKEAGTFEGLKEKLSELDAIQDPIAKCFSGDVFDPTKHAAVYSLWRKTTDGACHALRAAVILYFLAATTTLFDEEIGNFENLLNNHWAVFIGGLILRHIEISIMNSITICIDDDDGNSIDHRGTLNPFISLFNHSCDPMVIHYAYGEMHAIISLQNIKKGEQVYYDYGASYWNESPNERRSNLLEKFDFICECRACRHNWGPYSRLLFPSRMIKSWPTIIEETLVRIRRKYPSIMSMALANVTDKPLIISTTFDMINIYQRSIKYCTRELFELKVLLHQLFYSVRC